MGVVCFGGSGVFSVLGSLAVKWSDRLRIAASKQARALKTGEKLSWIQVVIGSVLL